MGNSKEFKTLTFVNVNGHTVLDTRKPYKVSLLSKYEKLYLQMKFANKLHFLTSSESWDTYVTVRH
jgi:hypothetical protein